MMANIDAKDPVKDVKRLAVPAREVVLNRA
jgi:hypothetical protein